MLDVLNVTKTFGGLRALDNCSIRVNQGEICGLIGPNGSGKSTLFNVITGYYRSESGEVWYNDKWIGGMAPYDIINMGISRTFQMPSLFKKMTVMENMLIAPKGQRGENIWRAWFGKGVKQQEHENYIKAMELLEYMDIIRIRNEYADNISFGQQKLLELARTLMTDPKMLLLDEPTGGINPVLVNKIIESIKEMRTTGMTFLIVEHNMGVISSLCDRVYVLDHGKNIAMGTPAEVKTNERVVEAYLGTQHAT
jgi:ABC-type branched-subunit amino acid transport system ATPase component